MLSISPITGNSYQLPNDSDKGGIDAFIAKNEGKKVVVVQGLGFVGAAMALVVANSNENYAVIGVDIASEGSYWKIASINLGELPLVSSDEKLQQYFDKSKEKENLYATFDEYAYSKADVIIVDINLDVDKESDELNQLNGFNVDLTTFKRAITTVSANCKEDALMLVETTVPPGTCQKVILPIVETEFRNRGLDPAVFKLAHSYERVMPGPNYIDSIENFYRVYSGVNSASADAAEVFLKTVIKTDSYPLTRLANTNATEISKVLENSYRAMNIAFIQEWTEFAEKADVDLYEVVSAIRMRPTHKNIMRPGLGVGGYCLTKDPLMASWAAQNLFDAPALTQSETSVQINDQMPLHTLNVIKGRLQEELSGKKVLILGVSYLNDVGDTRYTPVGLLYDELQKSGAEIFLHDPYLSTWDEKNISVDQQLPKEQVDIVVVTVSHKQFVEEEYFEFLKDSKPQLILDTLGCYLQHADKISKSTKVITIGKGN